MNRFSTKAVTRVGLQRFFSQKKKVTSLKDIHHQNLVQHQGFINGIFTSGSAGNRTFDVVNPANGKVIAQVPCMGMADAEHSAEVAMHAWQSWKETTANDRARYLVRMSELMNKYKDDLAAIITLEAGKPLNEAKGEILYAISFLDLYAEEAKRVHGEILQPPVNTRRLLTIKQPVGPAALITPWNFPSAMITRKLAPALAAGCTAVIKPTEETPLSALAICAIAQEAGLPAGVVNCLTVSREDVESVGRSLCHSKLIRKVSFTGSTAVGKWLMRESASTVKRISLELGGNAPFIVFDDADVDVAVTACIQSKLRNAGQVCIASNRILVQEGIYDTFSQKLAEAVRKLKVGDGFDLDTNLGPLINSKGLAKVSTHVEDCVSKGATVLTGGKPHHELNRDGGCFFEPTVLVGVTRNMLPFSQETFGPIIPLLKFQTEEEAISIANDTEYGLSAYFCTENLSRAFNVAEKLEAGIIGVNEGLVSSNNIPFGGWKESGIGREGGHQGIAEYLEEKYICLGLGKR
jgi:succinate-semialdehyde dehydrogenase/glutarate-semialdehyde dehydrogenase